MKLFKTFALIPLLAICSLGVQKVNAAEGNSSKGGAQLLMQSRTLKTPEDFKKVKSGDIVVSTCPMCKTTTYRRIDSAKGGAGELGQTGHGSSCPACGAMADDDSKTVKHACKTCGAEMVCAVIPGDSVHQHGDHADHSDK
jgi:ribosomal protein L37AE/L43A